MTNKFVLTVTLFLLTSSAMGNDTDYLCEDSKPYTSARIGDPTCHYVGSSAGNTSVTGNSTATGSTTGGVAGGGGCGSSSACGANASTAEGATQQSNSTNVSTSPPNPTVPNSTTGSSSGGGGTVFQYEREYYGGSGLMSEGLNGTQGIDSGNLEMMQQIDLHTPKY